MTIVPVQNYETLSYTYPTCKKGGCPSQRWIIVAQNRSQREADENAVLSSHPERRIDALLPMGCGLAVACVLAEAIAPLLLGEGWTSVEVINPASAAGFDHDAF